MVGSRDPSTNNMYFHPTTAHERLNQERITNNLPIVFGIAFYFCDHKKNSESGNFLIRCYD